MLTERVRCRMNPHEGAAYIGSSYSWIMREARLGRIPHYRIGHKVFFNQDKLDIWLDGLEKQSVQVGN
jgi:hypothetical protein